MPSPPLSGAGTALANVGPGLGEIIGPAGNFQSLERCPEMAALGRDAAGAA
jgi:hypothetical protein